jgi:hypothetical protein
MYYEQQRPENGLMGNTMPLCTSVRENILSSIEYFTSSFSLALQQQPKGQWDTGHPR